MDHIKLIFVRSVRPVSNFVLNMGVQLFQHYLLKSLYFLHWVACVPLSKNRWLHTWKSISLALFSVPLICIYFFINTTLSSLQYLIISLDQVIGLGSVISPTFFFFNTVLVILDILPFHINFRIDLSIFTKQLVEIFIGIALNW